MSDPNPDILTPDQQADDRLIHALLIQSLDASTPAAREIRVTQVISAIRQTLQTPPKKIIFPFWLRRGAAAVAAMTLLVLGIWFFTSQTPKASASASTFTQIVDSLAKPGDRSFKITIIELPDPNARPAPPENPPKPGLDGATLYLRDGKAYLLARTDPNFPLPIFDGFDGQNKWRIRRGKLDPDPGNGIPLPSLMADVPFSDLHQTLSDTNGKYIIQQFEKSAPLAGQTTQYVKLARKSHDVKGPAFIEIWADPKSSLPLRILFDNAKVQGNPTPCRLTLDLINDSPLPPNWFTPAPHMNN